MTYCIRVSPADKGDGEHYEFCSRQGGRVVSQVFCLPKDYRKDVLPPTPTPLEVFFKLPVSEISEIDDHKSIVTIRLSYKLKWKESRMVVNESIDWSRGEINISPENIQYLWIPDVIIHDLVMFSKPEILNEVAALEIFKNKMVYYKIRADITVVCKAMEFGQFPLDSHDCYFLLTSFGYDERKMLLKGRFSYEKENQRTLPFNVDILALPEYKTVFTGSSSNYSVYGFEIKLTRSIGPFILSVYLPSAMFVTMSWVSFVIPPDVVPARIVLLVTLCLVLINMFNSTTTRIPVSNTVTALEVWLLACMLLVFLSLVEYAVILRQIVIYKRKKDVSLGSHNPLCEYHHSQQGTSQGHLSSSTNSNNYTTINYNHTQPTSCSSKNVISLQSQHDREHGHSHHHGHYHQHRHEPQQEEENCFIQEPYRNLLVQVENTSHPPEIRQRFKKRNFMKNEDQQNGVYEQHPSLDSPWIKLTKFKTNLDRGATYLFPLMFILFNLFYWSYYLFITSQNPKNN